jgi:hypothetical protein
MTMRLRARSRSPYPTLAKQRRARVAGGSEPLRVFQHEVRTLVDTGFLAFDALRTGTVGLDGSTGRLFYRTLIELRSLADRIDRDTQ